ncbi:pharyngeal muscle protein 2 isoform X3 [Glossina fuscipes]|uniref:Pharyngeal muscle protein 2 isoform X3 n=1 Tax=Glossina fuscipes TaxID=7396 RepID=A0A9C5Z9W2_9MUSC|nr:pharyngeal muscle protein 2 isoform X3 [Glossina fuscipes]
MSEQGKKLLELRVSDLKEELERRRLDTIGPKAALIERLEKSLKEQSIDPTKHVFIMGGSKANEQKGKKSAAIKLPMPVMVKEEPKDDDDMPSQGDREDLNEKFQSEQDQEEENDMNGYDEEVDQIGDVDEECVYVNDDEMNEGDDNDHDNNEQNHDRQEANEQELTNDSCLDEGNREDETNGDTAINDNEEGINLTIGEDEQQLLHDEAPDYREKTTSISTQKEKGSSKEGKSEKSKDGKKSSHKDEKDKKKDDKSCDKKDESELKSSSKSGHKDDKGLCVKTLLNASANAQAMNVIQMFQIASEHRVQPLVLRLLHLLDLMLL